MWIHSTEATWVKLIPATWHNQFELLNDLIPAPKSGGRPREVDCGRSSTPFYILCEGCRGELCQNTWQTVYLFRNWRKMGLGWGYMIVYGSGWEVEQGRQPSPSEAIIDSQSIKSAAMLSQDVGFDGENWLLDANDFERRYLGLVLLSVYSQMLANAKVVTGTQTSQPDGQSSLVCTRFGSMVGLTVSHSCGDGRLPLDCSGATTKSKPKVVLLKKNVG